MFRSPSRRSDHGKARQFFPFADSRLTHLAAACPVFAVADLPLTANPLYMCECRNNGSLFKLNMNNAQASLVGPLKVSPSRTDLTFRGNALFGVTFSKLMTINPTTGKATLKSSTFGSGISNINALVVLPSTNKMFGASANAPGKFIEINPNTGRARCAGSSVPVFRHLAIWPVVGGGQAGDTISPGDVVQIGRHDSCIEIRR